MAAPDKGWLHLRQFVRGTMFQIIKAWQGSTSVVALVTLLFLSYMFAPEMAKGDSLKVSDGYHWTVLASAKDADNAIGIARLYGSEARAVLTDNGWFAAVLAPKKGALSDIAKNISWPGLAKDAFLSNGRGFSAIVWKPTSVLIASDTLDDDKPAIVSGGGIEVTVRRTKNGDGWTAGITGSIGGRGAFVFSQPFPDAADYETSVKLVRLNAANPYPDVVFDANTGGAHCCVVEMVVTRDSSGQWKLLHLGTYDGGGVWFEDADGAGPAEILHGDNSFLYQFASYAESRQPLVIAKLSNGSLTNISADPSSRSRMTQDLRGLEFQAKLDPSLWHSNSFLAAWVAEKVRIGEVSEAWSKMLGLHGADDLFGVMKCPGNLPSNTCKPEQLITLPFPEGLMDLLRQGGYIAPPSQQQDPAPVAMQADVSAPADSPPPPSGAGR
jgi:hypothetical protein